MRKSHVLVIFLVGTGEPLPNCNKITLLYGCGFGLKKLGLADPPPQLGQNPKKFQKLDLKAPLSAGYEAEECEINKLQRVKCIKEAKKLYQRRPAVVLTEKLPPSPSNIISRISRLLYQNRNMQNNTPAYVDVCAQNNI